MGGVIARWLPVNGQRRMFLRVLRSAIRDPGSIRGRLDAENWRHYRTYRASRFLCPVCGGCATPLYDFPDVRLRHEHQVGVLRETLQCRQCFSSMRQRSLAHVLLQHVNRRLGSQALSVADLATLALGGLSLLDTDNFSATNRLLRELPTVYRCSYLPDRPWGSELSPRYFNIDLQRMDLPDAAFDIVLSSDVMEHVRDHAAAHREIFRVLRPGGVYVFNVPYDKQARETRVLVDTSAEEDVLLCKPHIHGDPLSGGILAYRVFGQSLLDELRATGFDAEFREIDDAANLIVAGDVFVARKPA